MQKALPFLIFMTVFLLYIRIIYVSILNIFLINFGYSFFFKNRDVQRKKTMRPQPPPTLKTQISTFFDKIQKSFQSIIYKYSKKRRKHEFNMQIMSTSYIN